MGERVPGIGDPPILIFRWRHLWASTTSGAQLTLSPAGKRSCRLGEDSFRQSLSLYVGFGVCQVRIEAGGEEGDFGISKRHAGGPLKFGHFEVGRASLPAMPRSHQDVVDRGNLHLRELADEAAVRLCPASSSSGAPLRTASSVAAELLFGHSEGSCTLISYRGVLWEEAVRPTRRSISKHPTRRSPQRPRGQSRN